MKFLRDEAGQIDKGKLSTQIVTYIIPMLMAMLFYITQNPDIVNDAVGPVAGGLILAAIAAIVFNYQNPRQEETA